MSSKVAKEIRKAFPKWAEHRATYAKLVAIAGVRGLQYVLDLLSNIRATLLADMATMLARRSGNALENPDFKRPRTDEETAQLIRELGGKDYE